MRHVYRLIAIFSVILISCQENPENLTKSYLVLEEGDSTYVQFEKNDSNVIINYSILMKEMFVDIYTDSALYYCLDSKIYVVEKRNNILSNQIEGNRYSRTLFSLYKDNGLSIIDTNKLVTTNIGGFQVQSTSRIKREDDYIDYCDYKILNGFVDSNCIRIFEHGPLKFDNEGYQKVEYDIFRSTCSYYSTDKIDLITYLKETDISNTKSYILVDFFTYWCSNCIKAIPKLNEVDKSDNVKVLGIHPVLEEKQRLEKFRMTFECDYDLYGENAWFYYEDTEIVDYPYYVLLDAEDFQIIKSWRGYQENLEGLVNNAIALYEK